MRVYGRFGREAVARPALFSNAKRALRTHPYRVPVCYVASTGLPGTSQRTRQLRGLVTGVTRPDGRRDGERFDVVERQESCSVSTRTSSRTLSSFPHYTTVSRLINSCIAMYKLRAHAFARNERVKNRVANSPLSKLLLDTQVKFFYYL